MTLTNREIKTIHFHILLGRLERAGEKGVEKTHIDTFELKVGNKQ